MTNRRDQTVSTEDQEQRNGLSQQLYIEHLQQRLAQAEAFKIAASNLEQEVEFLRHELRSVRKTLDVTARARMADVQRCADNHVDKTTYRKATRRARNLERQVRQIRSSRSYRLGRMIGRMVRRVVPKRVSTVDDESNRPPTPVRPDAVRVHRRPRNGSRETGPTTPEVSDHGSGTVTPPNLTAATMLDARGCDGEVIAAAAEQLATAPEGGTATAVQDSLDFGAARRFGMRIEYIPDRASLAQSVGSSGAEDIIRRRWEEILAQHRPTEIYRPVAGDRAADVRVELVWFSMTEPAR